MNAEPAKEYLFEQTLALDPEQFEQLCKMILSRVERTENPELTPFRQDGGIDVRAQINRDLFYADLGVQAKRHDPSNSISGPGIQTFSGALGAQDFNVGAFITTASFTKPAVKESDRALMPIKLVNGNDLTNILIQNEIGVTKDSPDTFSRDHSFWTAFDTPEETNTIPSLEVPQADSIETLNYVLEAIGAGHDTKPEITEVVAPKMGGFRARQSDYYGIAGWLLGFLHKDQQVKHENHSIRRWGLTRTGEEYLHYHQKGNTDETTQLLQHGVRGVELVDRILTRLETQRVLTRREVAELIADETELNETTASRREKSVRSWITVLREVITSRTSGIEYQYSTDRTTRGSFFD